jgi:hypothetical protein
VTEANGGSPSSTDDVDHQHLDREEVCCIACRLVYVQVIQPYPRPCPRCGLIIPASK